MTGDDAVTPAHTWLELQPPTGHRAGEWQEARLESSPDRVYAIGWATGRAAVAAGSPNPSGDAAFSTSHRGRRRPSTRASEAGKASARAYPGASKLKHEAVGRLSRAGGARKGWRFRWNPPVGRLCTVFRGCSARKLMRQRPTVPDEKVRNRDNRRHTGARRRIASVANTFLGAATPNCQADQEEDSDRDQSTGNHRTDTQSHYDTFLSLRIVAVSVGL